MIDHITVHDYMTDARKKAYANLLLERYGIDPKSCDEIKVTPRGRYVGFHLIATDELEPSWYWVHTND